MNELLLWQFCIICQINLILNVKNLLYFPVWLARKSREGPASHIDIRYTYCTIRCWYNHYNVIYLLKSLFQKQCHWDILLDVYGTYSDKNVCFPKHVYSRSLYIPISATHVSYFAPLGVSLLLVYYHALLTFKIFP